MAYTKKIWKDYPDATTPINAEDLNNIEDGLETVDTALENLNNNVNNIEDGLETVDTSLNSGWISLTGTFTFVSWDSTAYTGVVNSNLDLTSYLSVGMKVKFTQNSAIKYAFITAITSTQLTLFLGTDYSLNNSAISNSYYSMLKAPFGFPMQVEKWTKQYRYFGANQFMSSPVVGTWYNVNSTAMDVPIGNFLLEYSCAVFVTTTAGRTAARINSTLSTSPTTEVDQDFTSFIGVSGASSILTSFTMCKISKYISVNSKTSYYLNLRTQNDGQDLLGLGSLYTPTIIKAVCAYL
jgi:hypothetical protein